MSFKCTTVFQIMPYVPLIGSLNSIILRGKYVKSTNKNKRILSKIKAFLVLQLNFESISLYEIYSPISVAI